MIYEIHRDIDHTVRKRFENELIRMDALYLSEFHHHMSEDVQEAHNSVPQPAVGQRLLVTSAGTLTDIECDNMSVL